MQKPESDESENDEQESWYNDFEANIRHIVEVFGTQFHCQVLEGKFSINIVFRKVEKSEIPNKKRLIGYIVHKLKKPN